MVNDKKEGDEFTLTVVLDEQKDNSQNWSSLHQCLLMLFDSPLNQAGFLQVYIRLFNDNSKRVIRLHKEVRVPRTFKRFEQLFNNFLQGCDMPLVQTKDGPARLFQFLNKPIEKILPETSEKYKILNLTPRLRDVKYFTQSLEKPSNGTSPASNQIVLFIQFGPVDFNFLGDSRETEYDIKFAIEKPDSQTYSISRYPLAPSLICAKITTAFERSLEIF